MELQTFKFNKNIKNKIIEAKFDPRWPMVYIIEGDKEIYIGETANVLVRCYQHLKNKDKKKLKKITFITSNEFNKSVALDLEAFLIKYIAADGKYLLQNGNSGLQHHEYYQKEKYHAQFLDLWERLREEEIVKHRIKRLEITNLYKLSPYKILTNNQNIMVTDILNNFIEDIQNNELSTTLITGESGTGKTVVVFYLMKLLVDIDHGIIPIDFDIHNISTLLKLRGDKSHLEIGLVVPPQSLRASYKKVFKQIAGLNANMVISPSAATKKKYDILIVDEGIRLRQRKALSQDGYATFNRVADKMQWDKNSNELEWILRSSKYQLIFYIDQQSIRPSDIRKEIIQNCLQNRLVRNYKLDEQLRCLGGNDYIEYTINLLKNKRPKEKLNFGNYEFKIFDHIQDLINKIKNKNKEDGLSRVLAGFAWKWKTKNKTLKKIKEENLYDIEIENQKYIWNTTCLDWVYSENAINEIGCIHTIQGYDLNYAGVIIGPDLKYDTIKKRIIIDKTQYFDQKGKIETNDEDLFNYITNVYHVLMTRSIKGTYLYICDENLRNYLKQYIETAKN